MLSKSFFLLVVMAIVMAGSAPAQKAAGKQMLRPAGFEPRFPYSPGVAAGDFVYIAGQGSRDPKTGKHPETFEAQVEQTLENMRTVLQSGGMDLRNAITCHVYLDDLENYGRMNAVYGKLMAEAQPVRTTIAVPALPDESHVEITCIAVRDLAVKKPVYRGKTPARPGLFPPGNVAGNWLFTSGVGSRDPATGKHPEGFPAQVRQVMETLGQTLKAGGMDFADVVWSNIYLDDPANIPATLEGYEKYFPGKRKPGKTVSIVARIPGESHIEITFLAAGPALKPREAARGAGVQAGDTLFLSAQSAAGATIEDQVKAVLEKHKRALRSSRMDLSNVVKAHVYLRDLADFPRMNAVYRTYFSKDPPARTTVQVKQPGSAPDAMVEISFVAVK